MTPSPFKEIKMEIGEFKSKLDIVSIIELFVPLRKDGHLFKACCPFHIEKTPSFTINAAKGLFFCFGCNRGGDAITFIQDYKQMDFKEAVSFLAREFNLDFEFSKTQKREFQFLNDLHEYFKNNVNESVKAFNYKRGLNDDDVFNFEIGHTGSTDDFLSFLQSRDYLDIALSLGYIKKKQNDYYFMFFNRLSFVLKDSLGRARGFSFREIKHGSKLGKYINSFKSDVFNKSLLLFNFDKAKDYARLQKDLLICEGFYDVIALNKNGFKNAVGLCGTAFTLSHLSIIKRLNIDDLRLIFLPDKDEAGYEAVYKAISLCFQNGFFNIEVAVCTKKLKDLGEFMQKHQGTSLKDNLYYYTALEYFIKHREKKDPSPQGKHKAFLELKGYINKLDNFYLKDELFKKLALILNIDANLFYTKNSPLKSMALDEDRQLKQIVKTALNDDDFRELAFYYIKDFGKYNEALNNNQCLELECDQSVLILEKEKQQTALKAYILKGLYKELETTRDPILMENLTKKIYKLKHED